MIVIPNNKGDHYSAVKKKCCLEKPIPSQCVTSTVLSKPKGLMSVATKVAIQMNSKLGSLGCQVPKEGCDSHWVRHVSQQSLEGMVGSSRGGQHEQHLLKALRKYAEINGNLPARIICTGMSLRV